MGIILFSVALILTPVFSLVALLHTIAGAIRYNSGFRYVDAAFLRGAKALDVFGNVAFATFLNDWFIAKGGYHYGAEGETISSATGKNWIAGSLSFMGKGLAGTLNLIDKDHCWKYIEGNDIHVYRMLGHPGKIKWFYTAAFIIVSSIALASLVMFWWWVL